LNDRPKTVLLVEDSKVQAMLASHLIDETAGLSHECTVEDGQQALSYLRREGDFQDSVRPDLVLLDIHMPILGGFEVLEAMRDCSDLCKIAAVVLTSNEDDVATWKSLAHPNSTCLEKPVSVEKLAAVYEHFSSHWAETG